jgi:subtilisin family serine protease
MAPTTIKNRLFTAIFTFLAFILIVTESALSAAAARVPLELMQKSQREGQVRVIVHLAVSEVGESPFDSDLLSTLRHANIAQAQNSVRAGLLGTAHRIHRQFRNFPFIALEVGTDGLQTLDSLEGLVTEVLEDKLHRPFLAESVPLVQADQVWAGGFGGTPYDGSGTVVAVLDTGVDKNHPFIGTGKVCRGGLFLQQ